VGARVERYPVSDDVRMAERGGAADFAQEFIDAGLVHGGTGSMTLTATRCWSVVRRAR